MDETPEPERELEALLEEGFFDQLVRFLESEYGRGNPADVEDAVAEAVANVLAAIGRRPIEDLRGYLYAVARNYLRRRARGPVHEHEMAEVEDGAPGPATQAQGKAVYDFIVSLVERWQNANVKTVVLICLDGAYRGEPLSGADIAELCEEILGRPLSVGSIYEWKRRGFARLAEELRDMDAI